jgi:hypothetical protein
MMLSGMRIKGIARWGLLPAGVLASVAPLWAAGAAGCRQVRFEGEVRAGESYTQALGGGMSWKLEATAAGWVVRVLPEGARPEHDAAELATPPYHSVTPLGVTTDWSFRAQDAVAWTPRRFQYAASAAETQKLAAAYAAYIAKPEDEAAMERLAELTAGEPSGELEILEARIAPGTANQTKAAAAVALHLQQVKYTLDQSAKPTALGALEWMRFAVTLRLARGTAAAAGMKVEACR